LIPFLEILGCKGLDTDRVAMAVETLKMRSRTLVEMAEGALFYFQDEITYEEKGDHKFLNPSVLDLMRLIHARLEALTDFSEENLESLFLGVLEEKQIKLGKIAQPLRVALTGKTASPGLFEVMSVLGKETVLARIGKAIAHIQKKEDR